MRRLCCRCPALLSLLLAAPRKLSVYSIGLCMLACVTLVCRVLLHHNLSPSYSQGVAMTVRFVRIVLNLSYFAPVGFVMYAFHAVGRPAASFVVAR